MRIPYYYSNIYLLQDGIASKEPRGGQIRQMNKMTSGASCLATFTNYPTYVNQPACL